MEARFATAMRKVSCILRRFPFGATALMLATCACFCAATASYRAFEGTCANTSTFALRGTGMTQDDVESVRERAAETSKPFPLVFWTQTSGSFASDPRTGSFADTAILRFHGELGLLFPDADAYPVEARECLASRTTSEALFGQERPTDAALELEGSDYRVIGHVVGGGSFVIVSGEAELGKVDPGGAGEARIDAPYTRLTTAKLDADGFPVTADTLASTLAVECDQIDYGLLSFAAFLVLLACPLAIGSAAAARCRRFRVRAATPYPLAMLGFAVCALVAVAATATFASALSEFGDYLPTTWSDFSAWEAAAQAAADGLSDIVSVAKGTPDLPVLFSWARTVALGIGSTMLGAIALERLAAWDGRSAAHRRKDD